MKLGNGLWEHTDYNARLQPTQIGLGATSTTSGVLRLDYGYGATASNNGNITTQTIIAPGLNVMQSYSYDQLNRLKIASEGANWRQTYDYDRYGNRAIREGSYLPNPALSPTSTSPTDLSAFDQATNRIARNGFLYDAAGNLTSDPTTGANALVYDAENRLTSKAGVSSYVYDGDGRRVKKIVGSVTTVMVYNAQGQLIAEYGGQAPAQSQTSYITADHLGSTRVVTDSGGSVKARHDYLPFGEEVAASLGARGTIPGYNNTDQTRQKFTSKERDNESGLDYFLARYYSSAQGRFTGVDPENAGAIEDDPQSWNGYAYARSNPLLYVDPDGREFTVCGPVSCGTITDDEFYKQRKHFEKLGFTFTGNGKFYEGGAVISPDGEVVASYKQTSIDDNLQRFAFEMSRRSKASKQAIAGFAVGTAVAGATGGAAAYFGGITLGGSSITTLALEATTTTGAVTGTTAATVAPQAATAIRNALTGFTKHGINSAISHDGVGVSTRAILDALKNPIKVIIQSGGRVRIDGKDATVVLNRAGKVITTWARSGAGTRVQP